MPCRNQGYILDGFPKTYDQAKDLFNREFERSPYLLLFFLKLFFLSLCKLYPHCGAQTHDAEVKSRVLCGLSQPDAPPSSECSPSDKLQHIIVIGTQLKFENQRDCLKHMLFLFIVSFLVNI